MPLTAREECLVDALLKIQDWDWSEGQYQGTTGYPASVVALAFEAAGISVRHTTSSDGLKGDQR